MFKIKRKTQSTTTKMQSVDVEDNNYFDFFVKFSTKT